ncbi:hypothetical protein CY34DRAFT_19857 [Suillus luteus UH-Slu-Lm8-n1]|uniref:Uncharacterized protein n=1 Tax=Suillus luteus UH-Slu-Lm8-n1 TaxID=930992 RepID=A0A0D0AHP2_9AGAM|nr:hypothetical protein CY34DRAFT_19857 [Suillus luteus UH-Slu-Lm8-n1]
MALGGPNAGIRGRTTSFIVSENSWPAFIYENYEANAENLEHRLMKSKLLVMGFKAIFTSPSSASEVEGDGDGTDVIENCRRARRRLDRAKVKTCVASIIGMRKVTPRAIAYIACQRETEARRFDSHFPTSLPGVPWMGTSTTRFSGIIS